MARRSRPSAQKPPPARKRAESYRHPEAQSVLRPDVGTQAQFRKKQGPRTYRYDSSLSPALDWDGQNPAREQGEQLLRAILEAETLEQAKLAAASLRRMSRPFLNWAGKAERLSFEVPTLPLFVHERLSTKAILETLKGHRRDKQMDLFSLFGDAQRPIHDQVLRAYEYPDNWVNRLILGDSLVVMNSLLHYEHLGGQVQMIYMDPPYGVRFGSNFQPFVRKRDVRHNDDADFTREPEMVQAYRDTWEVGLHSYLTFLRDRFVLCRELLAPSGSIFVQINDRNLHLVRALLDEVFGPSNFVAQIAFQTTSGFETATLATLGDFILWYGRDVQELLDSKIVKKLYEPQDVRPGDVNADWVLLPDGSYRGVTAAERRGEIPIPDGARLYKPDNLQGQGAASEPQPFDFEGKTYLPGANAHWKANYPEGMRRLGAAGRIHVARNSLRYRRFATDFPFKERGNIWTDTITGSFTDAKIYAVQTNVKVVERCILLATKPGDLVFDPTCGSGTTAYAAEHWGRRWITADTSRVPLALARQRLLTATFPYHSLKEPARGPSGGFSYSRRQDKNGHETGGVVPHIKLENIANDEPASEEVLVDRPDIESSITRVTGPFCVEATIPTPIDWEGDGIEDSGVAEGHDAFVDRMLEVLRRSPILHLGGGRRVELQQVRRPAKTLTLSAEARVVPAPAAAPPGGGILSGSEPGAEYVVEPAREGEYPGQPVAIVFGPESGAVSEKLVYEAAREAYAKQYMHLYVIGFAIQPNARKLVEECEQAVGVAATYVQATPDLMMSDLLKNMRSSQIFSVCGLPDVTLRRRKKGKGVGKAEAAETYEVELSGLDVFDPVTMESDKREGDDVPAWFLDTDYNGLCFHVCQAFFPRTAAWDDLKRSLRGEYDDSVWDHLAGTVSAPFEAGEHGQIAVKVIDDRGNELLVVKSLQDAEA